MSSKSSAPSLLGGTNPFGPAHPMQQQQGPMASPYSGAMRAPFYGGPNNNPFLRRTPPLSAAMPQQPPAWNAPMASNFQSPYAPQQPGAPMATPSYF